MKGMVFTQFLEMVEQRYSMDMVDTIIDESNVPSGGVYTAVGTYPHEEMASLVKALSEQTGIPIPGLLQATASTCSRRWSARFLISWMANRVRSTSSSVLDTYIHAEVRKLYPDAELPRFVIERAEPGRMLMTYISTRHMEDLAEGLLLGCFKHFGETVVIATEPLSNGDTRFLLTRVD
ncbi:MAG: heme NO-binding domain-containing protein [Methylotetracoccus sp.]